MNVFLFSCNKNISEVTLLSQSSSPENLMRKRTKSLVNKNDIKIWLNSQKGPEDSAISRNKFINNIIADVETGEFTASEWGEEEFIIIVALNQLHSIHESSHSKKYLVLFEDSAGTIYRGELGIITPEQDTAGFSQKDIPNIIINNNIGFYGTLQYVNFYDYQFAKKQFAGAIKSYEGSWGARVALGDGCTHWYLLHIDYDLTTGEILDYYTLDLGCLSCAPNSLCDELDGFGGGGGVLEQIEKVDTVVTRTMVSMVEIPGYNVWEILSDWRIRGTRNKHNPSLNRYTNIDFLNKSGVIRPPGQIVITHTHLYYFFIQSQSVTTSIYAGGASGTGKIQYNCIYPNQSGRQATYTGIHTFTPEELGL